MESLLRFPGHRRLKFLRVSAIALITSLCLSVAVGSLLQRPRPLHLSGGDTTVLNRTSQGFGQPAPNLSESELALHTQGDRAFEATFVTAPAPVNSGLGPLFNNTSCVACHIGDGRGLPVKGNLLVRVSLPPTTADTSKASTVPSSSRTSIFEQQPEAGVNLGNALPVPKLGTQIQDQAVYGVSPKAQVEIDFRDEAPGRYSDGTAYQLHSPVAKITLPNGQPLPSNVLTSLRVPPPVFGRGLLEAIPEQSILALADPDDRNQDGISGKANRVWDVRKKALVLGRFGLKANNPNLLQQNAAAYINDMGITNPLFPGEDGSSEVDLETLKANTFYTQTLAVPARTMVNDPAVHKGEKLFSQANCIACHVSELHTGNHETAAIAQQVVRPYSDLLLHDMGPELADDRPDFAADGNEWRTPPLWGLGLTQAVLPYAGYLHDGRARTLEEAILWHGGEAKQSKETFRQMPKPDRRALVKFLNSL
jgi:CxxC motif-containing protein (DUF1111 family)